MLRRLFLSYFAVARPRPRPDRFVGYAKVIDGDTIVVAGRRLRLHGLDAPELDQTFLCHDQRLARGHMAMAALEALVAGIKVECIAVDRDRHGRPVVKCLSPSGIDVGRRLVAAGWALAYRAYSADYVDAETEARTFRRGLWRGRFEKPWAWRARMTRYNAQFATGAERAAMGIEKARSSR